MRPLIVSGNEAGNDHTLPTTAPSNVFEENKEEREKGACLSGEVHALGNYPSGSLIRVLKCEVTQSSKVRMLILVGVERPRIAEQGPVALCCAGVRLPSQRAHTWFTLIEVTALSRLP